MPKMSRNCVKCIVLVMLLLLGSFLVIGLNPAAAAQEGDYTYTTAGSPTVATITRYTGTGGAITIPSTLGGFPTGAIGYAAFFEITSLTSVTIPSGVTIIDRSAFNGCTSLTSVTIPGSVTTIGLYAFLNCTSLTSVTIPDSVTSIGPYAFYVCSSLTSVTIPSAVTSIGDHAFAGCTSMTAINVDPGNPNYASIDGVLYNKVNTTLFQFPGGKPGTFAIPPDLTTIGEYALADCVHLTAITVDPANPNYASRDGVLYNKANTTLIQYPAGRAGAFIAPQSVTVIDRYGFIHSSSLTSVTLPNNITSIGDYTFKHCTALPSVIIPSGVTSIGIDAFADCPSMTSITFLGPVMPTVSSGWIAGASSGLEGHAYASSNFPAPGGSFNGLMMGTVITAPPAAPGAPTGLVAQNGAGFVLLNWIAPADPGSPGFTRYDVYRGTSSGAYGNPIGNVAADTLAYNDSTATPGTLYYYVVKAVNSGGSGPGSNEVTGTAAPTTPSAPQSLAANYGPNNVTLAWIAPVNDGGSPILSYSIYRSSAGGAYSQIGSVPASTLSYVDTNGTEGNAYSYYVVAINSVGAGTQSAVQSRQTSPSLMEKAEYPVAAVAVSSGLAFLGVFVVSRASETVTSASSTVDSGFEEVRARLRRFFHLDKVFDFVTDYFKERARHLAWKQVEKVEPEDMVAVERQPLFAGFSAVELGVIFFTSVFLGAAFMITNKIDLGSPGLWLTYILIAGLAVILHDLTHRYMAWRQNATTEYKFWFLGTIIMFITALLFGVVYSSPSRLAINDPEKMTAKQQAIIYSSGPIMSLIVFAVFLALIPLGGFAATIGTLGASMNLLTATYAMMPFEPMDGRKVYKWKKWVWAVMFVPMLALYFALIIYVL